MKFLSIAVLVILSLAGNAQSNEIAALDIGDAAPALKVRKWLKGTPVSGFEKGKVYVVEFWATWCLPCIAGMPHLSELAAQYRNDATVIGVDVWERAKTPPEKVEKFVDSMGSRMAYNVAADDSVYMGNNWLKASQTSGIPAEYIVDRKGNIAWTGLPKQLDEVLPKVIKGSWDTEAFANARKEKLRLSKMDSYKVVEQLNPYMGNPGKPDSALLVINEILAKEPGLTYYPRLGHFTFWSLIKVDQQKALAFGKKWLASDDDPPYKSVTDAVHNLSDIKKVKLIDGLYELAAYSYQAQIDKYPWSMDIPVTYSNIADLYSKAGNNRRAIEAQKQAIEAAKKSPAFDKKRLVEFEEKLKSYQS